ncbi:MAG: hypothetical protein JJV89_06130 [Desulfosarcina sp.]|nr:hypothetical protein [Desulfobacterales bacterium]
MMSVSKKICLGIDLTQHKPLMAIAEGDKIIQYKTLAETPPAALLPIIQHGESEIVGAAAHKHRRGTGGVWPPECQAPVYDNYQNGVGRIPLVCAWARLAAPAENSFSGILSDTDIGWKPTGEFDVSVKAERLITESIKAWGQEYTENKTAVIIPDSLNETAQQALIDNFDAFLTPRPIAVALSWCRRNAENYHDKGTKSDGGIPIGHLIVITMALDQWEIVLVEIRARIFDEKLWLVPVRNRVYEVDRIPIFGVGLFTGMSIPACNNAGTVWQFAFGSEKASSFADGKIILEQEQINAMREYISSGWTNRDRSMFGKWDIWKDLFNVSSHTSIDKLKEEMLGSCRQQLQYLDPAAGKQCLGVLIDGACACVPISENRRFGDIIAEAFEDNNIEISDGFEAVRGAAYTAAALRDNLPCYRETIIPIEIHYHSRNKQEDFKNDWKQLIEGTTIEAGTEDKSNKPVDGLQIKQGAKTLKLTLRRPFDKDKYIFRKVEAEIPQETKQDEPVIISANMQPGQGFAKVTIESVREGIFRTLLNWKTMEPCDPPPPPPLAYLPKISRIMHNEDMWLKAKDSLREAIKALKNDTSDLLSKLIQLRNHINKWLFADSVDKNRGNLNDDAFLYYGVFPSDGNLNEVHDSNLANEFANECKIYFSGQRRPQRRKEAVQRIASWLYLACPPVIIESARQNLKRDMATTSTVNLHTIGLCFKEPSDINSFFVALEQLFHEKSTGINEWLRTIRNIVRFCDYALKPKIVSRNSLENIISGLLRSLESQVKSNQYRNGQRRLEGFGNSPEQQPNLKKIFDNCVLAILYLLKRRRYEPDFLVSDNENYRKLDKIFSMLIKKKKNILSDRQFKIVSITLKFLHREANNTDLIGIMEEC